MRLEISEVTYKMIVELFALFLEMLRFVLFLVGARADCATREFDASVSACGPAACTTGSLLDLFVNRLARIDTSEYQYYTYVPPENACACGIGSIGKLDTFSRADPEEARLSLFTVVNDVSSAVTQAGAQRCLGLDRHEEKGNIWIASGGFPEAFEMTHTDREEYAHLSNQLGSVIQGTRLALASIPRIICISKEMARIVASRTITKLYNKFAPYLVEPSGGDPISFKQLTDGKSGKEVMNYALDATRRFLNAMLSYGRAWGFGSPYVKLIRDDRSWRDGSKIYASFDDDPEDDEDVDGDVMDGEVPDPAENPAEETHSNEDSWDDARIQYSDDNYSDGPVMQDDGFYDEGSPIYKMWPVQESQPARETVTDYFYALSKWDILYQGKEFHFSSPRTVERYTYVDDLRAIGLWLSRVVFDGYVKPVSQNRMDEMSFQMTKFNTYCLTLVAPEGVLQSISMETFSILTSLLDNMKAALNNRFFIKKDYEKTDIFKDSRKKLKLVQKKIKDDEKARKPPNFLQRMWRNRQAKSDQKARDKQGAVFLKEQEKKSRKYAKKL